MGIRNVPERGLTVGMGQRQSHAAGALQGCGLVWAGGWQRDGGGGGLAWT
jgi:hypothetical protein